MIQINKIRNEEEEITSDITEIQRSSRDYNKNILGGLVVKNLPCSEGDMGSTSG